MLTLRGGGLHHRYFQMFNDCLISPWSLQCLLRSRLFSLATFTFNMASCETQQAPVVSTPRSTTVDPAALPFTIDQPSDFFALSRELRDIVYEYVFYDDGQSRLPP